MTSAARESAISATRAEQPDRPQPRQPEQPTHPPHPKQRWLTWADDLVSAAWRHASPSGSLLLLPGPQSASGAWNDGLEGFARTFLAAAFRIRGQNGQDPHGFAERYARGLSTGVDPGAEERWPTFDERRGAIVEAASIAVALAETRPWLWDRLNPRNQELAVDWFSAILGRTDFTNNWLWFQNVIEAFLSSVGADDRPADLARNAELTEALYVGEGWYSDGRNRDGQRQNFDWYAGWAWHVYPLLESRIRGTDLSQQHRERLRCYLQQAQELIGPDGGPVLIGRSVTYRFGVLAPFWAGVLTGVTPLGSGQTRALGERTIDYFLARGARTDRGLLAIGWHRAFPRVRQLYTGSASPYWASKGLLGLLLPDDHPEWHTPADWRPLGGRGEQVPAGQATSAGRATSAVRTTPMAAPGWLVLSSPADGLVRVLNHGSDRALDPHSAPRSDDPFYGRVGYSNATSPQLDADGVARPRDSHTAVVDDRGQPAHRDSIERLHLDEQLAMSRSAVHWLDRDGGATAPGWAALRRGPVLTVASVVDGVVELRLAWWRPAPAIIGRATSGPAGPAGDAAWPREDGPWRIRFSGWAVASQSEEDLESLLPPADAWQSAGRTEVLVRRADGLTSLVCGLREARVADVRSREDADPFGRWSATPAVSTSTPRGAGELAAALVVLTAEEIAVRPPQITPGPEGITVDWPSGRRCLVPTDGSVTW